ncbi:MAG: hypothetical protein ACLQLC_21160 [Candidatus Sulfotelmatobacter sp.]
MQRKFPSSVGDEHAAIIREMTEELPKKEAELHDLYVEQIRAEFKGGQADRGKQDQ